MGMTKKLEYVLRSARFEDADDIFDLIKRFPEELLPRPISDITKNIDRFLVCDVDGRVAGCVSWAILPEIGSPTSPSVEIKSLAVVTDYRNCGIGKTLISETIERIKALDAAQIVVLTFTPDFFTKLGFQPVPKETLVHKIYAGCVNCTKYESPFTCPEVAMALPINKFQKKPTKKK